MTHSPKPPKADKPGHAPKPKAAVPPEQTADQKETKAEKKPSSGRIEIPLISTPNDQVEMEQEMEELFNEEKVKHRHGGTEPERD